MTRDAQLQPDDPMAHAEERRASADEARPEAEFQSWRAAKRELSKEEATKEASWIAEFVQDQETVLLYPELYYMTRRPDGTVDLVMHNIQLSSDRTSLDEMERALYEFMADDNPERQPK